MKKNKTPGFLKELVGAFKKGYGKPKAKSKPAAKKAVTKKAAKRAVRKTAAKS